MKPLTRVAQANERRQKAEFWYRAAHQTAVDAAAQRRTAMDEFREAIIAARESHSLRQIAAAAGITHSRVVAIMNESAHRS